MNGNVNANTDFRMNASMKANAEKVAEAVLLIKANYTFLGQI